MTRKAVAVLTLSSFAFLVAVIMLFSSKINLNPGPNTDYLGQTEIHVFNTYINGEKLLLYMDMAGRMSYQKLETFCTDECLNECNICKANKNAETGAVESITVTGSKEFMAMFASYFSQYLKEFNQAYQTNTVIADYTFFMDDKHIGGVCGREFQIEDGAIDYKFKLSFSAKSRIKTAGLYKISGSELEIKELTQPAGQIYTGGDEKRCIVAGGTCEENCDLSTQVPIEGMSCPEAKKPACCRASAGEALPVSPEDTCTPARGTCRFGCVTAEEVPFEGKTCPREWNEDKVCCKNKEEPVPLAS